MNSIKSLLFFLLMSSQVVFAQNDTSKCVCIGDDIEAKFSNLLKDFISFDEFNNVLGWELENGKELYEFIFYRDLIGGDNRIVSNYELKAVSYDKIRLKHPSKYYTIDLLPCTKDKIFYLLPLEVSYRHDIKTYLPEFDFTSFDYSPESYYRILKARARIDDMKFLKIAIETGPLQWKGKGKELSMKKFIHKVIKRNKIQLSEFKAKTYQDSIRQYLLQFRKQKVDLTKIALEHFVLYGKKLRKADDKIEKRLRYLFGRWLGNISYASIQRHIINPTVEADIRANYVSIKLSPDMIREWNSVENRPKLDSSNVPIGSTILCEVSNLHYSSIKGLNAYSYEICMPTSEITGTGILMDIIEADIVTNQKGGKPNLNYKLYTQCLVDSIRKKGTTIYEYSPLLTEFSGLKIAAANLELPFEEHIIELDAYNVLLNNKVLTGSIDLPSKENTGQLNMNSIVIVQDNRNNKLEVVVSKLVKTLQKRGLKNVVLDSENSKLTFFYKK